MKIITSTSNPEIKLVNSLKTSKGRDKENKFIAEGLRVCQSLIDSGAKPIRFYVTEKIMPTLDFSNDSKLSIVSESVMKKISSTVTPSGIICLFDIPKKPDFKFLTSGIVLAQISDPGNMGTLIRTAAAMAVKSIVIVEGVDPWSPKVVQASAGTIMQANIFQCSWEELIKNKKSLKLCALVVSKGKKPEEINFKDKLLVVGSEAHGIPKNWLSDCEEKMTIPMPGKAESLNAAIAGSIALYLAFGKSQ